VTSLSAVSKSYPKEYDVVIVRWRSHYRTVGEERLERLFYSIGFLHVYNGYYKGRLYEHDPSVARHH
jgi:hypothetical protein